MRELSHVIGRIAWTVFLTAYFSCFANGQAPPPNCETIAAPPPLATLGGPATAAPGNTELGIAVGAAGNIYPSPCGHEGFSDWLVRWRRGMNSRMDLGFDFEVDNHSGGGVGGTAKGAIRYQVKKGFRLEGGFGASDTGFAGGSLNADLAATIGTSNVDLELLCFSAPGGLPWLLPRFLPLGERRARAGRACSARGCRSRGPRLGGCALCSGDRARRNPFPRAPGPGRVPPLFFRSAL